MEIGDERALAARVRTRRRRRGLSQADLAEAARLSTKTIQRLESGRPVGPGSRRAVLAALDIDPERLGTAASGEPPPAPAPWTAVSDGPSLFRSLAAAATIEVELDREAQLAERRRRPWYRQDIVIASRDPIDLILDAVDRAGELGRLPPGRAAREQRDLTAALAGATAMGWGLATRVDRRGRLSLYLGAPGVVAGRVGAAKRGG